MIEATYLHSFMGVQSWRRIMLYAESELPNNIADLVNVVGTDRVVVHNTDGSTVTYRDIPEPTEEQERDLRKQQRERRRQREERGRAHAASTSSDD